MAFTGKAQAATQALDGIVANAQGFGKDLAAGIAALKAAGAVNTAAAAQALSDAMAGPLAKLSGMDQAADEMNQLDGV